MTVSDGRLLEDIHGVLFLLALNAGCVHLILHEVFHFTAGAGAIIRESLQRRLVLQHFVVLSLQSVHSIHIVRRAIVLRWVVQN